LRNTGVRATLTLVTKFWIALLLLAGCAKPVAPPVTTVKTADVMRAVREPGAKVVLLNHWATWCGPCREEFPDLVKLAQKYRDRGLRVVLLSWDEDAKTAQGFLASQHVDFPAYIKDGDESDTKFVDAIEPRWSGAFPATMIYDNAGTLRDFWEGKQTFAVFEQKVLNVMNSTTPGGKTE
jgi:thiol-disulfide isomerase/thioredoxin